MQRPYVGPSLVTFFFLVLLSFPHIAAQTNQKKKKKNTPSTHLTFPA